MQSTKRTFWTLVGTPKGSYAPKRPDYKHFVLQADETFQWVDLTSKGQEFDSSKEAEDHARKWASKWNGPYDLDICAWQINEARVPTGAASSLTDSDHPLDKMLSGRGITMGELAEFSGPS